MAVSNRDVRMVQVAYPQIYFACHTQHLRRASSATRISPADSTLLAHLDEHRPQRATLLARHLGLAASTLSAAIARLVKYGYVIQQRDPGDGRAVGLLLSPKGAAAMQASSVLESGRVKAMLERLTLRQRQQALAGLEMLARAAREAQESHK